MMLQCGARRDERKQSEEVSFHIVMDFVRGSQNRARGWEFINGKKSRGELFVSSRFQTGPRWMCGKLSWKHTDPLVFFT